MLNKKRLFGFGFVALMIIGTTLIGLVYGQKAEKPITKLSKTLEVSNLWKGSIDVKVVGMRDNDLINIKEVKSTAVSTKIITTTDELFAMTQDNKMTSLSGEDVPETALALSESTISFIRPEIKGKVLMFIEVPQSAKVNISYNDKDIAKNYSVSSAISVKGGVIGAGKESLGKSISETMFPGLKPEKISSDTEKKLEDGSFFVPFEKLQLTNTDNKLTKEKSFKAHIEIDEFGNVQNVMVLEPVNSESLKKAILAWKFIPYLSNGNPVKVSTVIVQK
jgi:hypothetical protein